MASQHPESNSTHRRRTRHAATPLSLTVSVVPSERTPEWTALWRRLLGPVPAPPDPDATDDPAHLPAARQGEAAGR
ncbi:MAG TPA: hypothetical protein VF916_10920 [Ktedonobacterales bacterium]